MINYQKFSFLFHHEYYWCYDFDFIKKAINTRIPATLLYYFVYIIIPKIFGIHLQDYKTNIGAVIISVFYISICYIFAKSFFLFSKENKPIIKEKIFFLIYILSFLFLSIPMQQDSYNIRCVFMNINEYIRFFEYNFAYIFLFPTYYALFNIIVKNTEYRKRDLIILCICAFITAFWNEFFGLFVFLTLFLTFIFYYILNKNRRDMSLLWIFIACLCGFIYFYLISDIFKGHITTSSGYNIYDSFVENIKNISFFIQQYIKYLFLNKIIYWLVIIFLIFYLYISKNENIQKDKNKVIILSSFIIIGYLATSFSEILVGNIGTYENYLFERPTDNNIEVHILKLVILILLGFIYFNSQKSENKNIKIPHIVTLLTKKTDLIKGIIISAFSILIISLSCNFINIYKVMLNNNIMSKILVYEIDKFMTIYSMLGESALLNDKYISINLFRDQDILPMHDRYEYYLKSDYEEFMKNKYFDAPYFFYPSYYNRHYKNKFIGLMFVDEEKANHEYNKRLEFLGESQTTISDLIKTKIKFKNIREKYGNRILSLKDIEQIEKDKGISDLSIKVKAYINYRDKNYDEALKLYNYYLSKYNPNDIDALINTAEIYKIRNNNDKAKDIYKKLIKLDSNNLTFKYKYLDIIYNIDKNYKQALDICDDMINTEPKMAANYINKGIVYIALNEKEKAKEMFILGKDKCDDPDELLDQENFELLPPEF